MDKLRERLIGELVGFARATDGNEHLISDSSTALIRECLATQPADEIELENLLGRIEAAKRAMVPDCFHCANPCGRNAALDFSELAHVGAAEREAKLRILRNLLDFCGTTPESALYRGLIALGLEGVSPEFLDAVAAEIHS